MLPNGVQRLHAQRRIYFFHTNSDYLVGLRLPMLVALVKAGYQVSAFAPNMSDDSSRILDSHGISPRSYELAPAGINPIRDLRDTWKIMQMLRIEAPEIVFSNNIKPVIFVTLAAALAGASYRYALVGGLGYAFTDEPGRKSSISRKITRIIASALYAIAFRLCDRVIFHNNDDRIMMVDNRICPREKAAVVAGSGVDPDHFFPGDRPTIPTFVFVGRLLADKGVREYLHAIVETKNAFPQARFLLVGGADTNPSAIDTKEVQHLVDAGLLEWKGKVSDVRPYLRESSIFVLPSYREGVPRSTLEAMACGLAVITTDAPGCRDTVQSGENGLLVQVGDAQALSAAMQLLCGNPGKVAAMGKRSREIVMERFSSQRVNADILSLIQGKKAS